MSYCAHCGAELPAGAVSCPRCGQPVPGGGASAKKTSLTPLYVLIGCGVAIVGVAVVGIVAALLIPNFLDALQKAKQKRAVAELLRMGQAVEIYKAVHDHAPAANDMAGLAAALGPDGAPSIVRRDPWQHDFRYGCWQESAPAQGCDHYRIVCAGRDGKFEHTDLKDYGPAEFAPTDYDRDIVFGDGDLIVRPRAP